MVANKTDLCSDTPPPLPDIEYGQPVHTPPESGPSTEASSHLRPRAVSATEGAMFAKEHGLLYVETSAKEGWHVVDAFEWTAREVLATISQADLDRRKVSQNSHPDGSAGRRHVADDVSAKRWRQSGRPDRTKAGLLLNRLDGRHLRGVLYQVASDGGASSPERMKNGDASCKESLREIKSHEALRTPSGHLARG